MSKNVQDDIKFFVSLPHLSAGGFFPPPPHISAFQRSARKSKHEEGGKKERGREDTRHVTPNHQSNPKRLMTAKRDGMQKETNEEKLRRRYLDSDSFLATLLDWGREYGHIHPHSTRGVLVRATVDDDDDEPRCCCSARVPIFFLAFSVASDRTRRQREKNISFFLLFAVFGFSFLSFGFLAFF